MPTFEGVHRADTKLHLKFFVHYAILESIIENIREMEAGKASLTIGYHDGKLVRSEIAPEIVKQQLVFLRDIRDFLKSTAVELVGLDAGVVLDEDMKKARDLLGAPYYEPILISKSLPAIYYADDAPMRSLASNSHGVSSFCTQALLRVAKERKVITPLEYEDAVITLLRHNYYFVSESFETLARLAELDDFQPSELSSVMLDRVADPKVNSNVAVRILSDFCFYIWRVDMSKAKVNRELWLELCLKSLLRAEQPEKLFADFLGNLGIRALTQPAVFGGIAHWILRSGKLNGLERGLFYVGVQQTIFQLSSLAKQEWPWWPSLQAEWWLMGRLNVILSNNGWI